MSKRAIEVVHSFFRRHGNKPIHVLLDEAGVTQTLVVREVYALAAPGLKKARDGGYLEKGIRPAHPILHRLLRRGWELLKAADVLSASYGQTM